jgi:hypothetical protein
LLVGPRGRLTVCDEREDNRSISHVGLARKAEEAGFLGKGQRKNLLELLLKYQEYFTSRPGRCNNFEYTFRVNHKEPIVGHTRPIPFSIRPKVQEQIQRMIKDGIIEPSDSIHINPLTIVVREG